MPPDSAATSGAADAAGHAAEVNLAEGEMLEGLLSRLEAIIQRPSVPARDGDDTRPSARRRRRS
jgi:hypothetical protein